MNRLVFIRAAVILLLVTSMVLGVWFLIRHFMEEESATPSLRTSNNQDSIKEALYKAEIASQENRLLQEKLLEQGYSEDALDGFLASGAERALQLKNIAEVKEVYGVPWNLTLHVGGFTLVDLYYVGSRFILGQYEDEFGRSVWLHMSITEDYENLTAGMLYEQKIVKRELIEYIAADGKLAGFAFRVANGETFSRYVATASFTIEAGIVSTFLGSVVDGVLDEMGTDANSAF